MQANYIDHMGSDARVVDAARVSFSKEASNYTQDQNNKLIGYLARHGHWTPFSHPMITMRETVPIFVARQRFKHTIGFSYNEVSRRYVDDEPQFHSPGPQGWRCRPEGGLKQGSSGIHTAEFEIDEIEYTAHESYQLIEEMALETYQAMIENGVAPEQARMVLPQSMLTSYYVTGSLAAWARAYKLRIDAHSQQEIQQLAHQWGDIIQPLFPVSWKALTS